MKIKVRFRLYYYTVGVTLFIMIPLAILFAILGRDALVGGVMLGIWLAGLSLVSIDIERTEQ